MAKLGRIKDLLKAQGRSVEWLATEVGMSVQGLHKAIRENTTRVDTIEKIAKALNCSILEFFDEGNTINISGQPATGNGGAPDSNIKQALDEIAEQRKLTSEAQRQSAELITIVKTLTNK